MDRIPTLQIDAAKIGSARRLYHEFQLTGTMVKLRLKRQQRIITRGECPNLLHDIARYGITKRETHSRPLWQLSFRGEKRL